MLQHLRNYFSNSNPLSMLTAIIILALLTNLLLNSSSINDLDPVKPLTLNTNEPQPNCTKTTNSHEPSAYEPKKSKASTNLATNNKPNTPE
uniref:H open reading frame n=1 Tax=Margaritifera dahurica TaxID=288136 RepID=X2CT99_MARDA|nr:h open reading frame [Margaritifera dahurica]AGZ13307.1 h open reading frame [Margaritifera dahurica]